MSKQNKKYQVISPDGFTIECEPFYPSKVKAKNALEKFINKYKSQAYYSTIRDGERLRIPIEELANYCELKTI